MKIKLACAALIVALAPTLSSAAVSLAAFGNFSRQFRLSTNVFDVLPVDGVSRNLATIYIDAAKASTMVTADEKTTTAGVTNIKALPWGNLWNQTLPAAWTAAPLSSDRLYDMGYWFEIETPIGKAMYANVLQALQSKMLVSITVDVNSWVRGMGYRIVQVQVDQ